MDKDYYTDYPDGDVEEWRRQEAYTNQRYVDEIRDKINTLLYHVELLKESLQIRTYDVTHYFNGRKYYSFLGTSKDVAEVEFNFWKESNISCDIIETYIDEYGNKIENTIGEYRRS